MSVTQTGTTSSSSQDDTSYFIGIWGNNVLVGSGANEVFFAPGGSEVLTGNGTSDVYIVDSTSKHIEITDFNQAQDGLAVYSSTGVSTLSALVAASHVTKSGLEIDFPDGAVVVLDGLTSTAALTASDTSFLAGAYTPPANAAPTTTLTALIGSVTPSFVVAGWGSHTLTATGTTNVFFAPGGNEVLTGSGSKNIYVVDSTTQRMEITNFNAAQDVLYLGSSSGVASLATLTPHAHSTTSGLELDLPNGATIVLDGVTSVAALTRSDTAFFEGAFTPPSTGSSSTQPSSPTPPVVTATPATLQTGQSVTLSSLVTVTDPAGHAIVDYYVYDSSGSVHLNGAVNIATTDAQAKGYIEVAASDFGKLTFVAGSPGAVTIGIGVNDGSASGGVKDVITVTAGTSSTPPPTPPSPPSPTAPTAPVVTASPATLQTGQSVALSSLVTVTDPAGHAIVDYYVHDSSGSVHLNGAVDIATTEAQAKGYIEVAASDFGKLTFVAGSPGAVTIGIGVNDGSASGGAQDIITVTAGTSSTPPPTTPTPPTETAPVVTATHATLQTGQSVTLSSLVAVTDPAGHAIVDYFVYDSSGSVHLNGAVNIASAAAQSKGYFEVAASDFSKLTFNAGSAGTVTIAIGAYDGTATGGTKDVITVTAGTSSQTAAHHHLNLHPGAESSIHETSLIGTNLASGALSEG